jgi:hypothetical protein
MATNPRRAAAATERTWKKLHAAYVALPDPVTRERPTLEQLARRHRVPLEDVESRAMFGEWRAERDAVEARDFFAGYAPGIKTELAFCVHRAAEMAKCLDGDLGAMGGEELLESLIADARVVWRRRMSHILIWEAMQRSSRFGPRVEKAAR